MPEAGLRREFWHQFRRSVAPSSWARALDAVVERLSRILAKIGSDNKKRTCITAESFSCWSTGLHTSAKIRMHYRSMVTELSV